MTGIDIFGLSMEYDWNGRIRTRMIIDVRLVVVVVEEEEGGRKEWIGV